MSRVTAVVAAVLVAAGGLVLVVAATGTALPRNPFVRLHYGTLASVLGAPLVLAGLMVHQPAEAFRLVLIGALVAGTAPGTSSALARALRRTGREPGAGS